MYNMTLGTGKNKTVVTGDNLRQMSQLAMAYRDNNDLLSSQWKNPTVKSGSKTVAKISYNGKVWDSQNNIILI